MKRFVFPIMPTIAFLLVVAGAAKAEEPLSSPNQALAVGLNASLKAKRGDQKEIDFALAEVRKLLESNPETHVAELLVDSDYSGDADTFLVNAVLDAHEQKLMVGVMLSLHPVANGWAVTMGFID